MDCNTTVKKIPSSAENAQQLLDKIKSIECLLNQARETYQILYGNNFRDSKNDNE